MTPLQRYCHDLEHGDFEADYAQRQAVEHFQRVYDALVARAQPRNTGLVERLRSFMGDKASRPVHGLYLWGGVGRGKSWLMNTFHDALPFAEKRREHFHSFMGHIHARLKTLNRVSDPLRFVADGIADQTRVISLDEFHVSDIADAMILGRLLSALFERGVTLVTTSNIHPDNLYKDGLQRERFRPTITLIKSELTVLALKGDIDFRLRALEQAKIYHYPLDCDAPKSLFASFSALNPEHVEEGYQLTILGRRIDTVRLAEGIVWFEFDAICRAPRSALDYIEIARYFHTVLIANVPRMGKVDENEAQRFIQLVDEFYDRSVNLIVSAAVPPQELYHGKRLVEPFERTYSRLVEMQSREYLHRSRLP